MDWVVGCYATLPFVWQSILSGGSRYFPEGGPTLKVGVSTYYFANFFAENCMKIRELGPGGISGALLDPPMIL